MNDVSFYARLLILLPLLWNTACSKTNDPASDQDDPIHQGTLYYSAADALVRYDFQTKSEVTLFSNGDHYSVSSNARQFMWYKNNFGDGTTLIQVHSLLNPGEYEPITLPYILEQTPKFIPETEDSYAALARAADGTVKRQDLVLFSSNPSIPTGRIPHVKASAVLPNGQDLVISAEALDATGNPKGFALALIKNFRSTSGQKSITICSYANYAQLPEDIAVSPTGQELVFTHLDHLYTVRTEKDASPRQITQSRFREVDAAWSRDGAYIVFTANTVSPSRDCGEIRIIPAHPGSPITIPEDGVDNQPVDSLQPVDTQGKTIHACGSESYLWL